ncbi:MAG: flippase-like domain-containing protein [Acidobacteria bacterium]|uniref:Flippase-like domain-containing protein n=1 Tax=Candidatus Polarisedimenticola svalbardensis TaxID=2886004 RepID=A0A8J6Y3W9_9BACT|nr:flippase-like domain-containing protein [Candidatus Polarisedimenticola svalbardensis]
MLKEISKYLVGLALATALFWWVLKGIDLALLGESLGKASIAGLALAGVLNISHNIFRVLRWKVLLRPVKARIPFLPMFSAVIVGYMTTWVIPGRLGELVRPALLTAREKVPLGPCLGSVLADRLMDMMAIFVLFAIGTFAVTFTGAAAEYAAEIQVTAVLLLLAAITLLSSLVLISMKRGLVESFLEGRGRLVGWIGRTLISVSMGTAAFRDLRLFVPIVFHSLMCWLMINLSTWVGLRAVGVDISLMAVFVLQPILAVGVAIPTPGGAGGYHAMMKAGLVVLFGVGQVLAVGAGILLHLVSVVPVIVLGTLLFWIEKYSMADIRSGIREVKNLGAEPMKEMP